MLATLGAQQEQTLVTMGWRKLARGGDNFIAPK